jgi:hypothetical protein
MATTRFWLFIQTGQHIFLLWRCRDLEFAPPLRQTLQFLILSTSARRDSRSNAARNFGCSISFQARLP